MTVSGMTSQVLASPGLARSVPKKALDRGKTVVEGCLHLSNINMEVRRAYFVLFRAYLEVFAWNSQGYEKKWVGHSFVLGDRCLRLVIQLGRETDAWQPGEVVSEKFVGEKAEEVEQGMELLKWIGSNE